jgi:hypothetical protein
LSNLYDLYAMGGRHISTDSAAGTTATDSSSSLADYLIVSTGQSLLYGWNVLNTANGLRYIFLFDSATVPANGNLPATGKACYAVIPVAANSTVPQIASYAPATGFGEGQYLNGIVLVVSTTYGSGSNLTLTIDTGKTTFIAAQYEVTPGS